MIPYYLWLVLFLSKHVSSNPTKVLRTTSDLATFQPMSGATLSYSAPAGHDTVTICARFLSYQFLGYHKLIQFGGLAFGSYTMVEPLDPSWGEVISSWQNGNVVGFVETDTLKTFPIWNLNIWNHVCISISFKDLFIHIVLNGETIHKDTYFEVGDEEMNRNLVVMGTNWGKGKDYEASFFGQIADINLWNRSFTASEMQDWTQCKMMNAGNMIDWSIAAWHSTGLEEEDVEKMDLCEKMVETQIIVADRKLNFDNTIQFCKKYLGGQMAVASNMETLQKMRKAFEGVGKEACGDRFFTGHTDRKVERKFVNYFTGEELELDIWVEGEPNNWGTGQDVSVYDVEKEGLKDLSELKKYCPVCILQPLTRLQLRGVCETSSVDTFYILQPGGALLGYRHSILEWSQLFMRWEIISLLNNQTLAFSIGTVTAALPLGIHRWNFTDEKCTDPHREYDMNLHLAVTQPGTFCCDDGLCIDSELRCDVKKHCTDSSDEKNCDLIQLPEYDYDKEKPSIEKQKIGDKVVYPKSEVEASITILHIIDINMAESFINVMFKLKLKWHDKRIKFNFLKNNEERNLISSKAHIWKPNVNFLILKDQKDQEKLFTKMSVKKEGAPSISPKMNNVQYNETYRGKENPILMTNLHQSKFICSFETIKFYPFDEQVCEMKFYIAGSDQDLAILSKKILKTYVLPTVDEHVIKGWKMLEGNVTKEGTPGLIVSVHLGRDIFSIVMVTYLPAALMNIINQATTYITKDNYDLIITVNITSMMVLVSIYLSVSSSLPTTPSIKPVEIWLLFNIFYPFMVIIINIIVKVD